MKKAATFFYIVVIWLLISCGNEPEKINFGSEACHYCKMTIVDQQHATQYVTTKGKQYKFDTIECMLNNLSEKSSNGISIFLVSDYANYGLMTAAQSATYLISKEIKSPMGAFLSAFSTEELARKVQQESGGIIYTWNTIKEKYNVK